MTGRVVVLAKAPVPGRVKTRLCPPCTPVEAAGIAAAALADTLDAVRRVPGRHVLACDGPPPPATGLAVVAQRGAGLAERIANAFADAGPGPALLIGMDTPQADPRLLSSCLSALDGSVDAVLGPAEDGGWWALGLQESGPARLLAAVPMSTSDTGRLTLVALQAGGLRVGLLPALRDVDEWPDAIAVARSAPDGAFAAAVAGIAAGAPA